MVKGKDIIYAMLDVAAQENGSEQMTTGKLRELVEIKFLKMQLLYCIEENVNEILKIDLSSKELINSCTSNIWTDDLINWFNWPN